MTKNEIQNKVVKLFDKHKFLLLTFATGLGKTLSAIKAVKSQLEVNPSNWLILCEELSHIDSWEDEFKKHNLSHIRKYFTISTYASAHKVHSNNIILDECHHALSEKRIKIIKEMKPKRIIALSATMSFDKKMKLNEINNFHEYSIPLKKALELNLLPTPKIIVKYKYLDDNKVNHVYIKNKGLKSKRVKLKCNYKKWKNVYFDKSVENMELHISCTEKQYYQILNIELEYLKKNHFKQRKEWSKFMWLNKASQRKSFLASIKDEAIKEAVKECQNKRYIAFTGSIKQCEALGDNIIHSKKKDEENELLLKKFNSKEIDSLFCVKKLREGVNLKDIECAIISQIDSEDLTFYQMLGRSLRGEDPKIYMIIVKDTQDEVYFESIKNDLKKLITYE